MFDNKTIIKELERGIERMLSNAYTTDIEQRFWRRIRYLGWGFIIWMIGELILIMATIGAAQVSLTLSSPMWKVVLMLLLLVASLVWGVYIPFWYVATSCFIFIGLVMSVIEEDIGEKYPLEFTNRRLFKGLDIEIFEEYL